MKTGNILQLVVLLTHSLSASYENKQFAHFFFSRKSAFNLPFSLDKTLNVGLPGDLNKL